MHRLHPVAQRIHHHLQHTRVRGIDRVPRSGVVDVIPVLVRQCAIIAVVINAFKRERGAKLIAFRRVVIHHVENHFDARIMISAHHIAKALYPRRAEVARRRRKKAQRVIAPEVFQTAVEKMLIVREPVNREQLNRGDAETFDVVHGGFMPHPLKGAAQFGRNCRVHLGKPFYVAFIHHGVRPGDSGPVSVLPVTGVRVDNLTFWRERRAVTGIKAQV